MYIILGASSFIGRHLYKYCKEQKIDVLGTYYEHSLDPDWVKFNICTDNLSDKIGCYLDKQVQNAIIICGANTSIDKCKRDEEASNFLNVIGTKKIIEQAGKLGIKCVFLSSEAVFDGKQGMYTEEDIPNPITLYGKQKLQIEQFIIKNVEQYLIFRISRASGCRYAEKDIFDEIYKKIINNEEIVCLKNQRFCLTEVNDIAKAIIEALDKGINGLYHLSSNNYISRYELVNLCIEKVFGTYNKVVEKDYDEISFLDKRHVLGGLKGDRLAEMLQVNYMSIDDILNHYKHTYEAERFK